MCGPSPEEQSLEAQTASLSKTMDQAFLQRFSTQGDILNQVQSTLGQLASGNYPPGYSPSLMSSLQTQALGQVAGATTAARQAAANAVAGQGGGTPVGAGGGSSLPSGVQAAVQGDIAAKMGAKQADLLNNLNIQSANLGRENLIAQASGLQTLANAQDPTQFGQLASSTGSQAFGEAKDINQQSNQMWSDIAGGVTGIAKAGLGVLSGGASNIASAITAPLDAGFSPEQQEAGDYLNTQ